MVHVRQDLRRALHRRAFRQAGYFTAAQARAIGYSYQAQKHHADTGNWVRVERGIFRLPDWPADLNDSLVLWSLWSDGRGVVSHASAARYHGFSDLDPTHIHLTVPPDFRAHSDAVILHRGIVDEDDLEGHDGWCVTTPLRTLVDLAGSDISAEHVERAVADAISTGRTTRRRILRRSADETDRVALRLERALHRLEERDA